MTMSANIMLGLITAIGAFMAAYITARYAERKQKLENEAAPYSAISARVTSLEQRLTDLEEKYDALKVKDEKNTAYILRAVPWIAHHNAFQEFPPPPPPDWFSGLS